MAEVLEAAAATIRKQQQIAGELLENGADVTSEAAVTTAERCGTQPGFWLMQYRPGVPAPDLAQG